MTESVQRARTDGQDAQIELIACAWVGCSQLFAPRYAGQKFHSGACRAAYSREVGLEGQLVSSRRMKRGKAKVAFVTDGDAVLDAPLGTRFRLVRLP